MPLVRIDVQEGRTPEELRKLADTIQDVMLDVFAAPSRDRYQIITEHPKGHVIAEDTGLGLERSEGIVIIQIFQQGRSNEQKVAMYAELAKRLEAECEVRPARSDRFGHGESACRLVVRYGSGSIPQRNPASADLNLT